jgi:hypothetical protein
VLDAAAPSEREQPQAEAARVAGVKDQPQQPRVTWVKGPESRSLSFR